MEISFKNLGIEMGVRLALEDLRKEEIIPLTSQLHSHPMLVSTTQMGQRDL